MTARRLRAPATDGGMLIDPPRAEALALSVSNADRLGNWDYDVQGRDARRLRDLARREVIALSRAFLDEHGLEASEGSEALPLIVTGHQPELFHPGVWVKNFATAGIARARGGIALNLIVDNDIPKDASIRVPQVRDGRLRAVPVPFDEWLGEIPYEDWTVGDESAFAAFPDRVHAAFDGLAANPLLGDYWPRVLRRRGAVDHVGLRFALARREIEASWGVANLELPLGRLCQTESFFWFASHLIARLPRYQEVHNACLDEYRASHRIRSRHHPVAALSRQDDWLETPFWVWRGAQPRRRALFARQKARTVELRIAGEDDILATLPLATDGEGCCAVERLRELAGESVRIRTRALTTTMFARFFLGDLFIHGIGGAKYDELGDAIAGRFFGIEPLGFLTLSLTLRLDLPRQPVTPEDLLNANRLARDLTFNPDRHLPEPLPDELRTYVMEKREALAAPAPSHRDRDARTRIIRRLNTAMQPWMSEQRSELDSRRRTIRAGLRSNRVAESREYASVLHPAERLQGVLLGIEDAWDTGS